MRKLLKILAYTLLGCFTLFILAIILMVTLVNPNNYKSQIAELIGEKLALKTNINGDIHWSFFPWLGFEMNQLTIDNPPAYDNPRQFLRVDHIDVSIKLLPLLLGKVEIGKFTLKDAILNIETNPNGQSNITDLIRALKNESASSNTPTTTATENSNDNHYQNLRISNFVIENAMVDYINYQTQKEQTIENLNIKIHNINLIKPFPIHISFYYDSKRNPGNVVINSDFIPDPVNHQFTFENLHIAGKFLPYQSQPISFNAKTNLSFNSQKQTIEAERISAEINKCSISGHFNYDMLQKNYLFGLTLDNLDLNQFTATNSAQISGATTQKNGATSSEKNTVQFSVPKIFRQISGNGYVRINKLQYGKLNLSNFYTEISSQNGTTQFLPFGANLYNGIFQGKITINLQNPTPQLSINERFNDIQVEDLLKDLAVTGKVQLTGKANLITALQTQGLTSQSLISNLNGKVNFAIDNGTIKNINIAQQIYGAINHILKSNADSPTAQTAFSTLTGTIQIHNGVAENKDLVLQSPSLQVNGSGTINLVQQTINYILKATALGSPFGQDILDFQQKIGGSFPIKISGNLSSPSVRTDYTDVASNIFKGQIKQQIEQHLGSDVSNLINGIIGN